MTLRAEITSSQKAHTEEETRVEQQESNTHLPCHWESWKCYLYESYRVWDHWGIRYYHSVGYAGWLDPAFPQTQRQEAFRLTDVPNS